MPIENIILGCVVAFLAIMLYRNLGKPEKKSIELPEKVRLISEKTGQIIEMKIMEEPAVPKKGEFDENSFLTGAKVAFQMISDAFTKGELSVLKSLLLPDVYTVFEKEIVERRKNKQTVEFSLVCFNSVQILNKSEQKDEITVQFVTDQINLLKNESGKVLEGDAMSIATVADVWTFRKKGKSKWVVSATKSEAAHG